MSAPATTLGSSEIALLEAAYLYVDREEVLAFLDQHPYLLPVLIEASKVIPIHFESGASLALDVFVDPECPADRLLYVAIRTSLSSKDGLAALDRFDEDWWLSQLHRTEGNLTFGIEHW